MPDKTIIDKILNAIFKVVIPDKVILFGSQARGDARPDSDYDILVIKAGIENGSEIEGNIYESLFDENIKVVVDVMVATPEIVEKYKNTIGCVIKPALREGVVIHGR